MDTIRRDQQYSISAAARLLGITRPTVYRYGRLGALPIKRLKNVGTPFIYGRDIISFINNY